MKVVLKLVDIDGTEVHEIEMDVAAIPNAEDYVTFEVKPGEWITRYVSVRRSFRFSPDEVIVELELTSLDDDEWARQTRPTERADSCPAESDGRSGRRPSARPSGKASA